MAISRRDVTPVFPQPIVEPPIPESDPGEYIADGPISPLAEVAIAREVQAPSVRESDAEKAIGVAETYFRREMWESAAEWYLKALDWNPSSAVAAEGFVMSAFQAGQYNYAYRIGEDISATIPGVKEKVIRAANEEISQLLKDFRFEEAAELLDHFPLEEEGFKDAREYLRTLKLRQARVNPDEFQTQTDTESIRGLVVNPDHESPGHFKPKWEGIASAGGNAEFERDRFGKVSISTDLLGGSVG